MIEALIFTFWPNIRVLDLEVSSTILVLVENSVALVRPLGR